MKKIIKWILCILCCVFLTSNAIITNTYACTQAYFGITWDNSVDLSNLSVQMGPSKYFMDSKVLEAMSGWNNISSNICVTRYTSSTEDLMSNDADINFHEEELTGTLVGYTHLYRKNMFGKYIEIPESETDSNYKVSQVRIGLEARLSSESDRNRYMVVAHELGHALLLCHPTAVGCREPAIMQTNSSNCETGFVTRHDKNNLIAKWGA